MPPQFRCLACKAVIYQINQRFELWWNEHCSDIAGSNAKSIQSTDFFAIDCHSAVASYEKLCEIKRSNYVICHDSIVNKLCIIMFDMTWTTLLDLQQKPGSWNFHRLMYHEVPVPSKSHKLTSISTCRLGRFTLLLIIFDKTTSEDASSWFVPAWRHTRTHTLTHTLGFQMKLEFCWPAKDALQPKDPKTLEKSVLVWGSVFHHEGRLKAKHMEETWTNFRSVW